MRKTVVGVAGWLGSFLCLVAAPPGALARPATTTRVSVTSSGTQGNDLSYDTATSADGRFVAFTSNASNLVPGDTNGAYDVFVHDRQTGTTARVSVTSAGAQGNGDSGGDFGVAISADGRFFAFASTATDLVPDDTNGDHDIFVHDRQTGATTRVSVSSTGVQGSNSSFNPSLSADGRFVTFVSGAPNLVPGDTNGANDVFVHDTQTGQTTRVNVSSTGTQANHASYEPSISADGRFVAFYSVAANLVPGDTNGARDCFVHDRQTGETTRVSVSSTGTQGNDDSFRPSISADGRFVAFDSLASNLVPGDTNAAQDIIVHDRQTGATTRVSVSSSGAQGNSQSVSSSISADGRFVAFHSRASDLVSTDTNGTWDAFLRDTQTGQTTRVSVASDGTQGNGESGSPHVSADGRFVAFTSVASNLVPGDTNGARDIFVHDRGAPCPGDANGDGLVNFADLNLVLSNFGQTGLPGTISGDVDADGDVDFADLNLVLSFFGAVC